MELKTKLNFEDNKQEILITREFDLPLELLFQAYADAEIVEQWMSTTVLKLENKQHGGWQFETRDADGNVAVRMNGAIHEFTPNERIVRTFQMENTPFPAQLEFLEFEKLTEEKSKLSMLIIFKSLAHRDQMLKLPFAQGVNMAHNRLQQVVSNLKAEHHDKAK